MSLLSRIRRLFWEDGTDRDTEELHPQPPAPEPPLPEDEPPLELELEAAERPELTAEEQELHQLLAVLEQGDANLDRDGISRAVCRLAEAGRGHAAADLLRQLIARLPDEAGLKLILAELLYDLKEFSEAVRLLEDLAEQPAQRNRAHFLLGDVFGREGNLEAALRHYEAVLALDFDFPRARGRADELRRRLDRPVATAAPTIFGAEEVGPGGRFVLRRELGRGGGGTVYLAQDNSLGRLVAVKVLHPHVSERQEARLQLFCEARVAAALRHPRIVTIYDLEESLNLVVMEYCAGGALADRIARAPLEPAAALRRLAEITSVLDWVHRCGVIHRDLKPANLLLRGQEEGAPLVLTDFGTAHAGFEAPAGEPTAAGSLVYMAPEQRRTLAPDARADLYACGVILIEMLLGHVPLSQQQAIAGAELLAMDDLWRELEGRLPGPLAGPLLDLCRSLVAPEIDARPRDAREVSERARALAESFAEHAVRRQVLAELEERAGPPPRTAEVERWLRDSARLLLGY
jgi:tetratricopeptide (TPR) repeat protein